MSCAESSPCLPLRRVAWLVTALVVTLAAAGASASTLELYGFGARSIGLAGTSEAVTEDYFATYSNPANLALGKRVHFGLGGHLVGNRFSVDRLAGQDRYPTVLPADLLTGHLGVSAPLGGWLANRLAIGIAMHIPLGSPTQITSRDYRTPQVVLYDSIGDRLVVAFGVGARVLDWLSIGVSAQLLASLEGSANLHLSALEQRFTSKELDIDLLSRLYPIVGLTLHPGDDFRLSLVWRAEAKVDYRLPLEVFVEELGTLDFTIAGVGLYSPDSFVAASSWRFGERALLTVAATWARWSALPPLAPELNIDMAGEQLGEGGEQLRLLHVRSTQIAMGAKDIVVPRLGFELQQAPWWRWRAGLRYRPTPFPKADGSANYLDAAATTIACGGTLSLHDEQEIDRRPLQVDIALGWTRLSRRTVDKRDPADPVRGTSLYGGSWRLALTLHHDF